MNIAELKAKGYCKIQKEELFPAEGEKYRAVILGSQLVKQGKGKKSFTTYRIRVINCKHEEWNTLRRYSEFYSLKENIKSTFPEIVIQRKFPPKKIIGNMTPELIDQRHQQLQAWFREVLSISEVGNSELIEQFLEDIKLAVNPEDIVTANNGKIYMKLDLGKMGYLWVLQKGKFKRIWCVLRNNVLYKYKSHEDKHPFDQVVFRCCTVTEADYPDGDLGYFCFLIITSKKKYAFGTLSEEDTEDWVDCIAEATYPLEDE